MQFRQELFGDVDRDKMSLEEHWKFIITRVLARGHEDEVRFMLKHYGDERCTEAVTTARYLDKVTLSFCCTLFNLKKEDFRCYQLRQLNPQHWEY